MGRRDLEKTQGTKQMESNRRRQTKLERAREISMASLETLELVSSPIAVASSSFDLEERFD